MAFYPVRSCLSNFILLEETVTRLIDDGITANVKPRIDNIKWPEGRIRIIKLEDVEKHTLALSNGLLN